MIFPKNFLLRIFPVSIIILAVINLLFYVTLLLSPSYYYSTDLVNPLTGAHILRSRQPNNLYHLETQITYQKAILSPRWFLQIQALPFRSLPFVALIFIPLTFLEFIPASLLFSLISLLAWFVATAVFLRLLPRLKSYPLILLFPLGYFPIVSSIFLLQLSPFIALVLVSLFACLHRNKIFLAGLLCSLLLFKIHFYSIYTLLLFTVLPHRWKFLAGNLIALVIISAVNLLTVSLSSLLQYPQFILSTESFAYGANPASNAALPIIPFLILLPLVVLRLFQIRHQLSTSSAFFLISLLSLPLSLHALNSDISLLIFPIFILFQSSVGYLKIIGFVLFLISILLVLSAQLPILGIILFLLAGYFLLFPHRLSSL